MLTSGEGAVKVPLRLHRTVAIHRLEVCYVFTVFRVQQGCSTDSPKAQRWSTVTEERKTRLTTRHHLSQRQPHLQASSWPRARTPRAHGQDQAARHERRPPLPVLNTLWSEDVAQVCTVYVHREALALRHDGILLWPPLFGQAFAEQWPLCIGGERRMLKTKSRRQKNIKILRKTKKKRVTNCSSCDTGIFGIRPCPTFQSKPASRPHYKFLEKVASPADTMKLMGSGANTKSDLDSISIQLCRQDKHHLTGGTRHISSSAFSHVFCRHGCAEYPLCWRGRSTFQLHATHLSWTASSNPSDESGCHRGLFLLHFMSQRKLPLQQNTPPIWYRGTEGFASMASSNTSRAFPKSFARHSNDPAAISSKGLSGLRRAAVNVCVAASCVLPAFCSIAPSKKCARAFCGATLKVKVQRVRAPVS